MSQTDAEYLSSLIYTPENAALLCKIFEMFPVPVNIYAVDGTSILVNQALLKNYRITDASLIIGKHNVFTDPTLKENDMLEQIKLVFQGNIIRLYDIKFPIDDFVKTYSIEGNEIETLYHDITAFPIKDDDGTVIYVVVILNEKIKYKGKLEIIKGKDYIEKHWQEPFSINDIGQFAGLSISHFTRLFKEHTGLTPHEYYIRLKTEKIKEKLLDRTLTIAQAFSLCGVDYNGHYAKTFKAVTGQTPSEYRNNS